MDEQFRDPDFELYERLRLSRDDLNEARQYLQLILKRRYFRSRPNTLPAMAAYTAFVVSYWRPLVEIGTVREHHSKIL